MVNVMARTCWKAGYFVERLCCGRAVADIRMKLSSLMQIICCRPAARRPACQGLLLAHCHGAHTPTGLEWRFLASETPGFNASSSKKRHFQREIQNEVFFFSCPNKEQQRQVWNRPHKSCCFNICQTAGAQCWWSWSCYSKNEQKWMELSKEGYINYYHCSTYSMYNAMPF